MRQGHLTRVELQLQPLRQLGRILRPIFGIAQDRVADGLHVRAQLVGPPGSRSQGHPGHPLRGAGDSDIFSLRRIAARVFGIGRDHQFTVADTGLDQIELDHPLRWPRRASDDRPIGLFRTPLGEGAGEMGGRRRSLSKDQHAGGVPVQAVHQLGSIDSLAPGAQQSVNVVHRLCATLDGEAGRLVERQHLVVLVEDQGADERCVAGGERGLLVARLLGVRKGRHPHHCASGELGVRFDPAAIDADLARARHLLDLDMVQVRPAPLEPAIQPRAVLAGADIEGANFLHAKAFRARMSPMNRAPTARTTDAAM